VGDLGRRVRGRAEGPGRRRRQYRGRPRRDGGPRRPQPVGDRRAAGRPGRQPDLALQSAQIADLTAAIAAQNRVEALEAARAASAEAQARENLARFLDYGSGYTPTTVRLFGE